MGRCHVYFVSKIIVKAQMPHNDKDKHRLKQILRCKCLTKEFSVNNT